MSALVLFTQSFPLGAGETFLETEIRYLAEAFSEILVVPLTSGGRPRPLPRGARLDPSLAAAAPPDARTAAAAAAALGAPFAREIERLLRSPRLFGVRGLRRHASGELRIELHVLRGSVEDHPWCPR